MLCSKFPAGSPVTWSFRLGLLSIEAPNWVTLSGSLEVKLSAPISQGKWRGPSLHRSTRPGSRLCASSAIMGTEERHCLHLPISTSSLRVNQEHINKLQNQTSSNPSAASLTSLSPLICQMGS